MHISAEYSEPCVRPANLICNQWLARSVHLARSEVDDYKFRSRVRHALCDIRISTLILLSVRFSHVLLIHAECYCWRPLHRVRYLQLQASIFREKITLAVTYDTHYRK